MTADTQIATFIHQLMYAFLGRFKSEIHVQNAKKE